MIQVQNKGTEGKRKMERMAAAEAMKVFEGRADMFVTDFGEALAPVRQLPLRHPPPVKLTLHTDPEICQPHFPCHQATPL